MRAWILFAVSAAIVLAFCCSRAVRANRALWRLAGQVRGRRVLFAPSLFSPGALCNIAFNLVDAPGDEGHASGSSSGATAGLSGSKLGTWWCCRFPLAAVLRDLVFLVQWHPMFLFC